MQPPTPTAKNPAAPTPSPRLLHARLMDALKREDHLLKSKAAPAALAAAREAVTDAMVAYDAAGFDPLEASVPHARTYAVRMHGGLLRHSVAQEWHEAVQEWTYGRSAGRSMTALVCDLCGCLKVHYWFELTNKVTGQTIRVGSECIQNWHSPGIVTAINFDRKRLEKAHKRELRLQDLEKAAESDAWLRARLPKLRQTIEKYGKVFDEAEDRVRAALGQPPVKR